MKMKLKNKLPMGTSVSPDVYIEMTKQTEWFIDKICSHVAKEYINGYHRKVTPIYDKAAVAKLIMREEEE